MTGFQLAGLDQTPAEPPVEEFFQRAVCAFVCETQAANRKTTAIPRGFFLIIMDVFLFLPKKREAIESKKAMETLAWLLMPIM
jgi:hypothetical protein